MVKRAYLIFTLFLAFVVVIVVQNNGEETVESHYSIDQSDKELFEEEENPAKENPLDRLEWEMSQLVDPKTGKVPEYIKQKELEFAIRELNTSADRDLFDIRSSSSESSDTNDDATFQNVGPFNIGGRTRALAVDINNENIILAGGVSGGVWKSTNGGDTWTRTTPLEDHPSVTDIVQDTRDGMTNVWYYSTGERSGNSANASGAFYFGNGIYKSTDGGDSWTLLSATAAANTTSTTANTTFSDFSLINELVIDTSNPNGTEMYAAVTSQIIKSTDGFETFTVVLGENNTGDNWTDIAVTENGLLYATIGNSSFNGANAEDGIFISENGDDWTKLENPQFFPSSVGRIEIGIDPNNEGLFYIVSAGTLYKYDGQTFERLSNNLDVSNDSGEGHNAQGGYNLYAAVHPGDENTVFIGGTNLLRSSDGFATSSNTTQVGGYRVDGNPESFPTYPNHHPDQHSFVFMRSNPDIMLSGSDGGVHETRDNRADIGGNPVTWSSLNNGYLTTQFYHAEIHKYDFSDFQILGGMQDNGNWASFDGNATGDWSEVTGGDGAFNFITYDALYSSTQRGRLIRFALEDNTYQFQGIITPVSDSERDSEFAFINPFTVNPVNQDQLVVTGTGKVFITNDVRENPGDGAWVSLSNSSLTGRATAVEMSIQPEGVLYVGSSNGRMYKVQSTKDANSSTELAEIGAIPGNGNVVDIAIDPTNANRVIAALSNYRVISLYLSEDGGASWSPIAGNLEENPDGTGAGPSVRRVEIMSDGSGGFYYFAGTSVGLYMTKTLDGMNTTWTQQAPSVIGNVVISAISARPIDGKVMVATHGNGVFMATYNVASTVPNINYSRNPDQGEYLLRANGSALSPSPLTYEWLLDGEVIAGATDDTFSATSGGAYQVRVTNGSLAAGVSNTVNVDIDGTGPQITSVARFNPTDENTSNTSVQFQITFDEDVNNVSVADFEASGDVSGTVSQVEEVTAQTVYNVTINNLGGSGTLRLGISQGNNIQDLSGNGLVPTIGSEETYTVTDTSVPTADITRDNPTAEVTDQNEVSFRVTFSEQVQNVDISDFELSSSSPDATLGTVTEQSGGAIYIVTVTEILEDGTLDLDFASDQNITDLAGNAFAGSVSTEETYDIQNVVSSIDEELLRDVSDIIVDANPSNGVYNLAFPNAFVGDFSIQVIDAQGSQIKGLDITGYRSGDQVELNISTAPDGLYILRAVSSRARSSVKLLKSTSR